ncbi:MAG: ATP-binding protein [Dehalococcoidales bacterium]|nr:ATP-binding protein [Dehalococcoidales bacterium]
MTFRYPLVERHEENVLSLAEVMCNKICTGFNQHAIIMIEGKTGTGKSNAALEFAFNVSLHMADKLGGVPEDYFTTENVAILTGEEVIRIAKNIKQHGIYILDDIGAEGLNARKWQSDINAVMTKILQTFRTKENLLIMTVPDRGFVDKIARNLLHYKIVMKQAWFSRGITLAKLSTVTKQYSKDNGNNNYPFIRDGSTVYNYAVFTRAPKHLIDSYEKARHEIEEQMRLDSIAEFEENLSKSSENSPANKAKKSDKLNYAIQILKENNPELSYREIGRRVGCGKDKVASALRDVNLDNASLSVG